MPCRGRGKWEARRVSDACPGTHGLPALAPTPAGSLDALRHPRYLRACVMTCHLHRALVAAGRQCMGDHCAAGDDRPAQAGHTHRDRHRDEEGQALHALTVQRAIDSSTPPAAITAITAADITPRCVVSQNCTLAAVASVSKRPCAP